MFFLSLASFSEPKLVAHQEMELMPSHNLNFVADISTRILLLEKGLLLNDLDNRDGMAMAELNDYFGMQI